MVDTRPGTDWQPTYSFFYYKFRSNTSDKSYEELRQLLSRYQVDVRALRSTREDLRRKLHFRTRKYDACINGCMAFTGLHKLRRRCLSCNESRFLETSDGAEEFYPSFLLLQSLTPRATYSYIPIIPRLRLLYANEEYSRKMRYPRELLATPWADRLSGVRDVWDGKMMQNWKDAGILRYTPSADP
jgi:hypothetical protein